MLTSWLFWETHPCKVALVSTVCSCSKRRLSWQFHKSSICVLVVQCRFYWVRHLKHVCEPQKSMPISAREFCYCCGDLFRPTVVRHMLLPEGCSCSIAVICLTSGPGVKTNFFHHLPGNVPKNILNRPEFFQESFLYFESLGYLLII